MSSKQTAAAIAFMKNNLNVEELDTNAEPSSWWEPCSERSLSFSSLNSLNSSFSSGLDAVQKSLKNSTIGDNQDGGGGRSDGSGINDTFDSLDESAISTDFSDTDEELNAGMPRSITTSDSEREEETISSSFEGSEPGETTNSIIKTTSAEESSSVTLEATSSSFWSTSDSDSTSFVDSFYTSSDNSSSSWGSSSSFPTSLSTSSEESSSIVESD